VLGRRFSAPHGATAQVAKLLQQTGALIEQLFFEGGGELSGHEMLSGV
jgi:hypothetical protein